MPHKSLGEPRFLPFDEASGDAGGNVLEIITQQECPQMNAQTETTEAIHNAQHVRRHVDLGRPIPTPHYGSNPANIQL